MRGLPRLSGDADDSALARRAATGDGKAFARLYERHESRVFNLCYRILGSRDDAADATQEAFLGVLRRLPEMAGREPAFRSYVLTSARNASYDLIERGRRARPSGEISDSATPVGAGVGGGGVGFDPGDPEDDPERRMLLEARTEEIRLANLSLPERQREVLALRELEELSYEEIAELMEMNRNSVAQLISRARINLRDALRGSALASIAASSPDCEAALRLVALEQDGELDEASNDAGWLTEHLMHCHTCRLGRDAMQEAGVSYRAWAPIAAGPVLLRETMARAAEQLRAYRTEAAARHQPRRGIDNGAAAGGHFRRAAILGGRLAGRARAAIVPHRRRDLTLIGVLTCLLLLVVLVGATSEDDPLPVTVPAAEEGQAVAAEEEREAASAAKEKKARKKKRRRPEEPAAPVYEPVAPAPVPVAVEPEPAERPKQRRPRTRVNLEPRPEPRPQRRPERQAVPEITPELSPAPPPTETAPPPAPPPEPPPAPPPPPPQQPPPPPPCTGPNCPPPPGP